MGRVTSADLKGLVFPLSVQVEELGSTFVDSKGREFRYVKYNDGDDDIQGLRGHMALPIGANAANVSTIYEVTANYDTTTVVGTVPFGGIIIPDVVLNGEYCWTQIEGIGLVAAWADAAQTRITTTLTDKCIPGAADGTMAVLTAGLEQQVCIEILADIDGVPTAATDRYYIPLISTHVGSYVVGETVTGGSSSDTAVVVEKLSRGTTDYGLIVSTATSTYFQAAETLTGGTSGATATTGDPAFVVYPQNYNIV